MKVIVPGQILAVSEVPNKVIYGEFGVLPDKEENSPLASPHQSCTNTDLQGGLGRGGGCRVGAFSPDTFFWGSG